MTEETTFEDLPWRKSTHSGNGGECVQTARLPDGRIAVRGSKQPEKAPLVFTPGEWAAFIAGVKAGEFDG